jgi:hypothetical protein
MRLLLRTAVAMASLFLLVEFAQAQPQPYVRQNTNPYYTPPLSPWLNMLRGGNPAVNYYLGVIPEAQQRTLNAQFSTQMLNQRLGAEPEVPEMEELLPTLPGTWHGTQFMNASPYFALNPYLMQTAGIPRRPQGRTGSSRRPGQ